MEDVYYDYFRSIINAYVLTRILIMIKLVMCLKTMLQLLNTKLKRENFRIEKLGMEKHIVSIKFLSSYEFLKGDRL